MYKKIILVVILLILGYILFIISEGGLKNNQPSFAPSPSATSIPKSANITASFKIITGNITRNFSNAKYHNQSPEVFITADDPSIIYLRKEGVTWQDFFDSLPMKLTKDCLTTGDGETYCNQTNGILEFFLNEILSPNLLSMKIENGDSILIKFNTNE